jgi:glutamate carboxypeptidase
MRTGRDRRYGRPMHRDLVTDPELDALHRAVTAREEAFIAGLREMVGIDCGSYTPEGVDRIADLVEAMLRSMGASVERHPDPDRAVGDTVVATFEGSPGGSRILLIGHMDTVFDPGTAAARPFRVERGRAYGPGVTDMKGGLLALVHGVGAVLEVIDPRPFGRLVIIANPDEEIGSPASTSHVRRAADQSDAVFVLECARANGDIVSSRKGTTDYRITIHGRAAHAGVEPEKGRSAILEAAHQVAGIHALNGCWPGVTANVGVIGGGLRSNVVAENAVLGVDVRAVDAAGQDAADAAIRELAAAPVVPDVRVRVEALHRHRPMEKLPAAGRLVEHAQGLAERLGFEVADAATGGASDANTTAGMGVPTLDGLGPIGGMDHSPDEYLEVDSIVPRTTLFAALLVAAGRDPALRRSLDK